MAYIPTNKPGTGSKLKSQEIRTEFQLIANEMELLDEKASLAVEWATSTEEVAFGYKGARGYAIDAAESAANAQEHANDTEGLFREFRGIYYGVLDADPALNPNGELPEEGDWYRLRGTGIRMFDGSAWENPMSGASLATFVYTATGAETSLSGADDNGDVLSYAPDSFLIVYKDGARLAPGADYTATTGNSITGLTALTMGEVVVIDVFTPFEIGSEALLPENNLNDVQDVEQARLNLGLGGAAERDVAPVDDIQKGIGTGLIASERVTLAIAAATLSESGSKVAIDGQKFTYKLVLEGDWELDNISNPVINRTYTLTVKGDSSTPRELTLGNKYAPVSGLELSGITDEVGNRRILTIFVEDSNTFIVSGAKY